MPNDFKILCIISINKMTKNWWLFSDSGYIFENRYTKVGIPQKLLIAAMIKTWFQCKYFVSNKNMTQNING